MAKSKSLEPKSSVSRMITSVILHVALIGIAVYALFLYEGGAGGGVIAPSEMRAVVNNYREKRRERLAHRDLVIRVTAEGETYVGSRQVQKQGMLDAIREASQNPRRKVRFEVDRQTRLRHLMPIWDQLKHYGLTTWSMRTQMSGQ
jgi:hypothetical protein